MAERVTRGAGGEIRADYAVAAKLGAWTLETVGPGLYRLRASLFKVVPPLLALDGLAVWIDKGKLRWTWPLPADSFGVEEGRRLDAIVGVPKIGPASQ